MNRTIFLRDKEFNLKVVKLYYNGMSMSDISKILFVSESTVKRILLKNNIKIKTRTELIEYDRNYSCFETIDTEEKAYWLGFIFADGCVFKNRLQIVLSGKDKQHLIKFSEFISNGKLKVNQHYVRDKDKCFDACSITVVSNRVVQNLKDKGVSSNKSLNTNIIFSKIPEEILKHFWRGYFDGDGCILKHDSQVSLISGTEEVCKQFANFIKTKCDYNLSFCKQPNRYTVSSASISGMKILNLLYEDCNIYLERKYLLFQYHQKNFFACRAKGRERKIMALTKPRKSYLIIDIESKKEIVINGMRNVLLFFVTISASTIQTKIRYNRLVKNKYLIQRIN